MNMISRIQGTLIEKSGESLIVEAAGVGYEIFVPAGVLLDAGIIGDTVTIRTHLDVKEDSMSLYGFIGVDQLDMFRMLISVSKIGPRIALNILSVMSVEDIVRSVDNEEVDAFTAVSGIGSKTGKRLILELAEKVSRRWPVVPVLKNEHSGKNSDSALWSLARNALQAQGFSAPEIEQRIAWAGERLSDSPSIQEILSQALRYSGGPSE